MRPLSIPFAAMAETSQLPAPWRVRCRFGDHPGGAWFPGSPDPVSFHDLTLSGRRLLRLEAAPDPAETAAAALADAGLDGRRAARGRASAIIAGTSVPAPADCSLRRVRPHARRRGELRDRCQPDVGHPGVRRQPDRAAARRGVRHGGAHARRRRARRGTARLRPDRRVERRRRRPRPGRGRVVARPVAHSRAWFSPWRRRGRWTAPSPDAAACRRCRPWAASRRGSGAAERCWCRSRAATRPCRAATPGRCPARPP